MNLRRISVVAVTVAAVAATVAIGRRPLSEPPAVFTRLVTPKTPFVPLGDQIASTFFCPGMPTSGEGVTAEVNVANPLEKAIKGEISAIVGEGAPRRIPFEVGPRASQTFDIAGQIDADFAGILVEMAGGGTVVEQRVGTPAGTSVSTCGNDASASWYFADGVTGDGLTYSLLLSNPFQDTASVNLTFRTSSGSRTPSEFDGFVIPPNSIRVIPLDTIAQDEEILSISAVSRRGRFVAAKSQAFTAGDRRGYVLSLGSPSAGDQWYFADGEKGEGIRERIVLYNPTEEEVTTDLLALPDVPPKDFLESISVVVPPGGTMVVDPAADITGLADGPYALVVSTLSTDSIVAERVLTRPAGESMSTTAVLGSRYGSPRWWLASGVPEPTEGALVVQNVTNLAGTVTVSYVGPGGPVPLSGLVDVPIGPRAVLRLDLTAAEAVGKPVLVSSPNVQLIVEQRYPRGSGPGLNSALAVPE